MNAKVVVVCALFAVLIFGALNTEAKNADRKPKPLNIKEPLSALKAAYDDFKNNFKLLKALALILEVLSNCLIPILLPPATTPAPTANFPTQFNHSQLQFLAEKISKLKPIQDYVFLDPPADFCNSAAFKQIHHFIWVEDKQLEDLVHFAGRFGYPEIYKALQLVYTQANCTEEMKQDLPKAPENEAKRFIVNKNGEFSNVREQLLETRNSLKQEDPKCNLFKIISDLPETGLIELAKFVETILYQFNTNHNLHFLIGKIQEPIKGKSVHKFRELEAVQSILSLLHKTLTDNPMWAETFAVIKEAIGVDFMVINPYGFLFSLFEYLVWGTPFPAPPSPTTSTTALLF